MTDRQIDGQTYGWMDKIDRSVGWPAGLPTGQANRQIDGVFTTHSKIFDRIMFHQLSDHFGNIFRKGFGCQTALLMLPRT